MAVFAKGDDEHCSMFHSDEVRNGISCTAEQPRGYAVSPLAGTEKSCHPDLSHYPVKPPFLIRHTAMPSHYDIIIVGTGPGGGTLNMGAEQERLDSLPGARARVTGLAPKMGPPGVEFLEYDRPTAGRPFPIDSYPTDLWHWQTMLVVPDVEAAAAVLRGTAQFVSIIGQNAHPVQPLHGRGILEE